MAKYQKFEELPVWQAAAKLYNHVLDLIEQRNLPLSPAFRNQLERATLSISNNIAEGFERVTTAELLGFLAIARGSAGEVRSMLAVVQARPRLRPFLRQLHEIRELTEACARQLTAWANSIESSSVQGKRHLTPSVRQRRQAATAAENFRSTFLRNLKPGHPLFNSDEARTARGEPEQT